MYSMFVKAYNEDREHGGINGHTPSEMFLMKGRLSSCKNNKTVKQIKSVTHVGKLDWTPIFGNTFPIIL
jgi:hypothetical protein